MALGPSVGAPVSNTVYYGTDRLYRSANKGTNHAVVSQAPTDVPLQIRLNQNGTEYCTLSIPALALISSSQNGLLLPPLLTGARVTLDITQVGETNPGSDLTVIIRL